jgi:hypothetical protein
MAKLFTNIKNTGNLTVGGSTTFRNVNIAKSFVNINSENTDVTNESGLVFNYSSSVTSISGNVIGGTSSTITTTTPLTSLISGDFVQVSGAVDSRHNGIYEVGDVTNTSNFKVSDVPTNSFCLSGTIFGTINDTSCVVSKVSVGVVKFEGNGDFAFANSTNSILNWIYPSASKTSHALFSNFELTQKAGSDPSNYYNYSVYAQKTKSIVGLFFKAIPLIDVDLNSNPIVSNFIIPISNIVPDVDYGMGVIIFCGTTQAYAKIIYDATASNIILTITPTTPFTSITTSISSFYLEYKCNNNDAIVDSSWGFIAPTIIVSTTHTGNLIRGQTTNITFTVSEEVTDFSLGENIISTKGSLSILTGSGKVYTALFTPLDDEEGDYTIRVLPGVCSFNGIFNKFETTFVNGIDTQYPSIASMAPDNSAITVNGGSTIISLIFSEIMDDSVLTNLNTHTYTTITPIDSSIIDWSTIDNQTYTTTFTSGSTGGVCELQFTELPVSDSSGNSVDKTRGLTQGLTIGAAALVEFDSKSLSTGAITSWAGTNGVSLNSMIERDGPVSSITVLTDANLNNNKVVRITDTFLHTTMLSNTVIPDEYWSVCLISTHNASNLSYSHIIGTVVDEDWWSNTPQAFRYSSAFVNGSTHGYYQYGANAYGIQQNHIPGGGPAFPDNSWVFNAMQVKRGSISTTNPRFKFTSSIGTTVNYTDGVMDMLNTDALIGKNKQLLLGVYLNDYQAGSTPVNINNANYVWANDQRIAYYGIFPISTTEAELDTKIASIKSSYGITW